MNIIFFDIESTGVSITKDRIVQLSAIKLDQDLNILDKKKILINPTIPIEAGATKVHGISDQDVQSCPTFKQISKGVHTFFKDCILAGYNIKHFDVPLLIEEFYRCEIEFERPLCIDSYQIFAHHEKRDLTAAVKFYTGETMENAHDAEADNLATIEVFKGQKFMYDLDIPKVLDFCNSSENLDLAGKIVLVDGVPTYSFGKSKGIPVVQDKGFGEWMLRGDFSRDTKNVVKKLIYG